MQDKGLDSFGPRKTSSDNNPTCCLRLGLIIIMRESSVNQLFVSSPRNCFFLLVPLGEPCPSLYKLEGRVTCGVLVGLGLVYLLLQVNYKSGSCFLVKEIFVIPFFLSRPIINVSRPSGPWALSSIWNTRWVINESSGS